MRKHVIIAAVLYDKIPPDPSKDELDTLTQVEAVSKALKELGYSPVPVEFHSDIDAVIATLKKLNPSFVFNLAESLRGRGQFISFAPLVMDFLKVPYTGCPASAIFLTSNKTLTKRMLSLAGIPTPPWLSLTQPGGSHENLGGRYIVKSVWEHASIGLDEAAVLHVGGERELERLLERKNRSEGGEYFAERYIEGREFNISLLSRKSGESGPAGYGVDGFSSPPEVLIPSEMTFVEFPDDRPRILDYRAKWEQDSREYNSTVRNYEFSDDEAPLLETLRAISLQCWGTFGLNGYARVDFRVDVDGRPFVLEINANPCISPDSGFVAAAEMSKLSYLELIERIVHSPVRI